LRGGAIGAGVTDLERADSAPLDPEVLAWTVNEYELPLVSPSTIAQSFGTGAVVV